jgi:thioredoxin 1
MAKAKITHLLILLSRPVGDEALFINYVLDELYSENQPYRQHVSDRAKIAIKVAGNQNFDDQSLLVAALFSTWGPNIVGPGQIGYQHFSGSGLRGVTVEVWGGVEAAATVAPSAAPAAGPPGKVVEISDAAFDGEIIASPLPALVDFWAPWCGPCRAVAPVVEELARDYGGRVKVAKLNVDDNPKTPARFGLRAIPTLIFFKGGQVVEQITGAVSRDILEKALKKVI